MAEKEAELVHLLEESGAKNPDNKEEIVTKRNELLLEKEKLNADLIEIKTKLATNEQNKERAKKILSEYDMIIPKKTSLIKGTYWENYKNHYLYDALKISREIIKEEHPQYLETFDEVLSQSSFSNYNMFIAPKEIIEPYCTWVFSILEELEKRVDMAEYPRVFGFVSEAIFNVWIEHHHLKTKEVPIFYLGNKLKFRMSLSNNKVLRKGYQILYFNFFNTHYGKKIEDKIIEWFY